MLAKRASERYCTARDLADDLRHFLRDGPASGAPVTAPARSPGRPLDPGGHADPARARAARLRRSRPSRSSPRACGRSTATTPTSSSNCCPAPVTATACPRASGSGRRGSSRPTPTPTFKVGLIYGPSGCGKSSLVKAGLLPRLARHVLAVYIEATAEETEAAAAAGPAQGLPRPARRPRRSSMRWRRCGAGRVLGPGEKVLLVLDQFEQWLLRPAGRGRTPSWSPRCGSATASTSRRS